MVTRTLFKEITALLGGQDVLFSVFISSIQEKVVILHANWVHPINVENKLLKLNT